MSIEKFSTETACLIGSGTSNREEDWGTLGIGGGTTNIEVIGL